jgi:RNA polymerase sigma-70 factor (ECF subfamily)
VALFQPSYRRLYRYLDRLSGDPELAADLAQEALVRLYRRGEMPESPEAWLVTVALNLFRNAVTTERRRHRLLSADGGDRVYSDPAPPPDDAPGAEETRRRVRAAVDTLPERDRMLLLLRAEGYSYRELAQALELHEASVGTLLARAKQAFREAYRDDSHAS